MVLSALDEIYFVNNEITWMEQFYESLQEQFKQFS